MSNAFSKLLALLPKSPQQVGDVVAYADGVATVQLPGGGVINAVGAATVGQRVFVRGGAIEGEAPALPVVAAEV